MLRNYITRLVIVGALIAPTHAYSFDLLTVVKKAIQINNISNAIKNTNIPNEMEKIAIIYVENIPKDLEKKRVDNR